MPGRPCAAASCADIGQVLRVHKTGADPHHYTVELPKPLTKDIADMLNGLFKQVDQ